MLLVETYLFAVAWTGCWAAPLPFRWTRAVAVAAAAGLLYSSDVDYLAWTKEVTPERAPAHREEHLSIIFHQTGNTSSFLSTCVCLCARAERVCSACTREWARPVSLLYRVHAGIISEPAARQAEHWQQGNVEFENCGVMSNMFLDLTSLYLRQLGHSSPDTTADETDTLAPTRKCRCRCYCK